VGVLIIDRRVVQLRPRRLVLQPRPVAKGLEAPFQQPVRLTLLGGDETDDILRKPLRRRLRLDVRHEAVLVLLTSDGPHLLDRLGGCAHKPKSPDKTLIGGTFIDAPPASLCAARPVRESATAAAACRRA